MTNRCSTNLVNLFVLSLLPISIMAHAYWLPISVSAPAISDAGYVSIITLTFLTCAFLSLLIVAISPDLEKSKLTLFASAYALVIYFLREADVHRLYTIEHVTRPKFYTMEMVPVWQKIFAGAVFILLAICLFYLLFNYAPVLWKKIRSLQPWAIAVLLWFISLFVSQLSDKSDLNRTHFGRVIEENAECWASIFIFLAVVQIIPTLNSKR